MAAPLSTGRSQHREVASAALAVGEGQDVNVCSKRAALGAAMVGALGLQAIQEALPGLQASPSSGSPSLSTRLEGPRLFERHLKLFVVECGMLQ